jgi:hypothetical protein
VYAPVCRCLSVSLPLACGLLGLALVTAPPASAGPAKQTRGALVAFEASPFPFTGTIPGQDKPFLDAEQDGRRGHTSPRGGIYWEDTTYADRRTLLHIPKGFDLAKPGIIIVYFHGNQATLERDVRKRQQVPRQVAQSGLNAVLVAPQFAVNALDSTAGRFYERGHFKRFMAEAAVHLAELAGDARTHVRFDALPVVFVAYSGGYVAAAWVAHVGGLGDRLRGIITLDSPYGEFEKFADWIAQRESGFFFSCYSKSARDENEVLQRMLGDRGIDFARRLPGTVRPGSVTFYATGEDVPHSDFVTQAWGADPLREVLAKLRAFQRASGPPPPPPPQRGRKKSL